MLRPAPPNCTPRRSVFLTWLVEDFDLPTDSKMPWRTNAGKGVAEGFDTFGIRPENNPIRDQERQDRAPSFSKDAPAISEGTEAGNPARAPATSRAEVSWNSRWIAPGMMDSHPEITSLHVRDDFSMTNPSLLRGSRTGRTG